MTNEHGLRTKVFNEGSDARLAGRPVKTNPYKGVMGLESYWTSGWNHVHNNWGHDAQWAVKPLVSVKT